MMYSVVTTVVDVWRRMKDDDDDLFALFCMFFLSLSSAFVND